MQLHRNAKLGLSGASRWWARFDRISVRSGETHGVSLRPHVRGRGAGASAPARARVARLGLQDRSSRPHRCPGAAHAAVQERICAEPAAPAGGPRLLAWRARVPALDRFEDAEGATAAPARSVLAARAANRYEWPCPGDLLTWTRLATCVSSGPATHSPVIVRQNSAPSCGA